MLNKILAFEKDYTTLTDPYKQVDALNAFCWLYMDSMVYTDLCYEKALLCADVLKTINYPKGYADHLSCLCYYSWAKAKYEDTLKYANKAIAVYQGIGDKEGEAICLNLISNSRISKGNYDEAFRISQEAIKLCRDCPASVKKSWTYYTLAILYFETKDYDAAEKISTEAMAIIQETNSTYGMARGLTIFGSICINREQFDLAHDYITRAIPLYREVGHDIGLSRALNDLGVICRKLGQYEEAEKYFKESYEIRKAVNHKQGIITSAYELGKLMIATGKPDNALEWLSAGLIVAREIGAKTKEFQIQKALAEAYKLKGDYENAYTHLEQFIEVQTAVVGQDSAQRLKQIQTRMATEQAEKEAELERRKNTELKLAHDIIAVKNKEIVDSINYAKRLQDAILPPLSHIKKSLPDSFVLYKPKDIVAGDFYWMERTGDTILIAAADCTGHGVPGALVSVVCSTALNRTVKEFKITEPGKMLDKLRELVLETFEKSESNVQDGMDISLCSINTKTNEIQWSGAYNSLVYIQNGELKEVEADKQPIGKNDKPVQFTTHNLKLQKGDMLYLLTDGYADQFGGPNGKKFKCKQLEELLLENASQGMEVQKKKLEETLENWKGNLEQVDDILIMGIKLS